MSALPSKHRSEHRECSAVSHYCLGVYGRSENLAHYPIGQEVEKRSRAARSNNVTRREFGRPIAAASSNFVKVREMVSTVRPRWSAISCLQGTLPSPIDAVPCRNDGWWGDFSSTVADIVLG